MKNIQRHDSVSMSRPPNTGPNAEVSAENPDQSPMARPRSPSSNEALMIAKLPGTRSAAPTPCTARAAISCVTFGAKPHQAEARAKTATPSANSRFLP